MLVKTSKDGAVLNLTIRFCGLKSKNEMIICMLSQTVKDIVLQ
jgi:hypothetical protein